MITITGTVTEYEHTGPPELDPVDPPVEDVSLALQRQTMRDLMASHYNSPVVVEPREGEVPPEAPKNWVHIHIKLDEPHVGELQVNAPESQVTGMLQIGGRARVMFASN